ncbi:MAG: plastocyanin/azurin family copper-binding protein [Dehalococcoidia bacterium]
MEYVQTALVRIRADKLGDASGAQGLLTELERHRAVIRRRPGSLRMTMTRSTEEGGDTLLSVETRWRDARALDTYNAIEPNVVSIIRSHGDEIVPDSLQVRRAEALESESEESKRGVLYERFGIALLVPIGIVAFGLAIIYSLSRVYLEIGNEAATAVAALVAILILLVAWYFASNPGAIKLQVPAIALVVAGLLIGGTVYAQVHEGPFYEEHVDEGEEPPDGGPGPGDDFVLTLEDNFFLFDGEENPTIQVGANVDVTMPLENAGGALHNVHVAASGGFDAAFCSTGGEAPCSDPERMPGGSSGTLTFNLPPGTYDFRCDFHTQDMTGTLEVVEGGPTGPSEAPPPGGPPPGGPPPGEGGEQTIELDDNVFVVDGEENPTISIAAGTDVTFTLDNIGGAIHNMHVAASGDFDEGFCTAGGDAPCSDPARINGGSTGTITINLAAGSYDYRCDFHTQDMSGTLEVQ